MNLTANAVLIFGLLSLPLAASTVNIDFGKPSAGFVQGTSTSATYTFAPGFSVIASGYNGSVTASTPQTLAALYAKTNGGDEQGLGLAAGTDREITPGHFIQLDLSQLNGFGASSFKLGIDSSTPPDAYALYLSNIKGVAGTLFATGTGETSYSVSRSQFAVNPYLTLTATNGNVLVGPGTVTSAPEPGTMFSLGAGLLLAGWRLRKLKS